jgi:beta-glucosidase
MKKSKIPKGMTEDEIKEHVEQILPRLTLKEKAGLMTGQSNIISLLIDFFIIKHYNRKPYPTKGVPRFGIPPVKFSDGPRGVVSGNSTCFPVSIARGASWDVGLEEQIGDVIGRELRALDSNYYGGVCINLLRHPAWGRAQETYGEDPHHLGEMGSALLRGVQKHNVMACIKHYAMNSIENARFKVSVEASERTLREVYLPHFKRCIDEGAASVMGAYNKFRGDHCCESEHLLTKVLRDDWGFEGFVLSDFLFGIRDTVKAVNAGCDIEMPFQRHYGNKLIKAVKQGKVSLQVVDRSVRRILNTIIRFATREDPEQYKQDMASSKEHIALSLMAAEKSITLLKNDTDILPLSPDRIHKLALIGRLADVGNIGDHGSSRVHPKHVITPLQGFRHTLSGVEINHDSGLDIEKAKRLAKESDAVVMVVGYQHSDEGEYLSSYTKIGGDRDSLSLKEEDILLINTISKENPATCVVLIGGSAITVEEWLDNVPAILMAWYPGMEGGIAIAKTIFGEVNPSGKLPFTVPKYPSNLPYFDKDAAEIEYGYYHGYRLFDKKGYDARYAFGYGLSYTTYKYDNLKVTAERDTITASVDVSNTGKRDGEEVVQLYIGFEGSKVDRPLRVLKAFDKVLIKSGEMKQVKLSVNKSQLSYYDESAGSWIEEDIVYRVFVGPYNDKSVLLETSIRF